MQLNKDIFLLQKEVGCTEITITVEMMLVHNIPLTIIFLDVQDIFIFESIWLHQILTDFAIPFIVII